MLIFSVYSYATAAETLLYFDYLLMLPDEVRSLSFLVYEVLSALRIRQARQGRKTESTKYQFDYIHQALLRDF